MYSLKLEYSIVTQLEGSSCQICYKLLIRIKMLIAVVILKHYCFIFLSSNFHFITDFILIMKKQKKRLLKQYFFQMTITFLIKIQFVNVSDIEPHI